MKLLLGFLTLFQESFFKQIEKWKWYSKTEFVKDVLKVYFLTILYFGMSNTFKITNTYIYALFWQDISDETVRKLKEENAMLIQIEVTFYWRNSGALF
jgi:hypothetical protein